MFLLLFRTLCLAAADQVDVSTLPPPASRHVDFATDIKPIFEHNCIRCHGAVRPKGKFRIDDYASLLKGGRNGPAVSPGDSTNSPLIQMVARLDPDSAMPPEDKGEPLTMEQVSLLRAWVDQGAWPGASDQREGYEFIVSPVAGFISVRGNESKFREHAWQHDGWSGGLESFSITERISPDSKYTLTGRALTDDYRAGLLVEKQDFGFARFGFEQFRKYDSDTGGWYKDYATNSFAPERDLYLDIGRVWMDVGLALPDRPRIVLGYEHQYRTGDKSTLQWGPAGNTFPPDLNPDSRAIVPSFKNIDERVHILKLDFDYETGGWRFEDNFRGEWTDLRTRHDDVTSYTFSTPSTPASVLAYTERQGWRSFQGVNTFRVERQFKDWLYTSAGYLYSHLTGDADFSLNTFDPSGVPVFGIFEKVEEASRRIVLNSESHVGNVNAMLGPWRGLTLTMGVQGDWTRQDGTATGFFTNYAPSLPFLNLGGDETFLSDLDKASLNESASLRFTSLPFTTLFAEANLQQERIRQSEDAAYEHAFSRDTEARSGSWDARAGFDTSPRSWVKLGSHYRWRNKSTTYDDGLSSGDPADINGYPTFISARDATTHEVESRLTLHPCAWLKTTFTHRLVATDTHVETDPAIADDNSALQVSPGGRMFAGNYDAQVFSFNLTMTPWRRLHWFNTFSYQDISSISMHERSSAVVPYCGDVYSINTHAQFVLTAKTDLNAGYTFSRADFRQNNFTDGLPLGIAYQLHGVNFGLVSRCSSKLTASVRYGFYSYNEPSSGHMNDYTAHAVFAMLTWKLD
ncbi:MAG: hypothetical protein HOP33_06590 [Verrucomicrobia bacterium]|nr:hypothetical protein [Verrucomicrobiota bacterium]